MPSSRPARRRRPSALAAVTLVCAVLLGTLGCQAPVADSAPPAPPPRATSATPSPETSAKEPSAKEPSAKEPSPERPPRGQAQGQGKLGVADGAVPEGTTIFDDDVPGVAKLDRALLTALREAAEDADDDGIEFVVNSGWRSSAYQQKLLQEAVQKYGSREEAERWVAAPDKSLHVSGDAVDLGPTKTTKWLSEHGTEYGLCQIYDNEPWHYELRTDADDDGCPPRYADPTKDPRLN